MGIFDIFKKKPSVSKATVSMMDYDPSHAELEAQRKQEAKQKVKNALKHDAGLYPHEILLLSYYEKYAAGKPIARFWQYEFGIDDVPALMKSLQERGFADGKSLTTLGEEEVKKSEYITYVRRHKYLGLSVTDLSILVNKNPSANYRDLIWGELNKNSIEYAKQGRWGLYRNERYSMYLMLMEDRRYLQALYLLFEVVYIDMNDGEVYPIAPGIVKNIRELSMRLDMSDEEMIDILHKECKRMSKPTKNFLDDEVVLVFVAYAYGNDEIAERVINKKLQ